MMKDALKFSLTRLQWIALLGMVAITVLGGGMVWYLSEQLDGVQAGLQGQGTSIEKFSSFAYTPNERNIEMLKQNNQKLEQALTEIRPVLNGTKNGARNELALVEAKNPVVFKQQLAEKIRSLTDLATKNGVQIDPRAAYFGFSTYKNNNPSEAATLILGKQLIGIREISTALFNAHISSLLQIRRSFDENGEDKNATEAKPEPQNPKGGNGEEALRVHIVSVPSSSGPAVESSLYTVYPFEFEFEGSEASVREALTNLTSSPYFLIPRSLKISSKRTVPPQVADLAQNIQSSSLKKPPTFLVVMGDDELHVHARIDLIEWTELTKAPSAPTSKH